MDIDELPDDNPAERGQAKALREQARAGGRRFEAYLPPALADWLLERIERGTFADPGEAVFAIVGNFRDLEPHRDLRDELLGPHIGRSERIGSQPQSGPGVSETPSDCLSQTQGFRSTPC